jgi:hypothetical protein
VITTVGIPTKRRTVVVLGRSARGATLPLVAEVRDTILVLAIGWPLTDTQRGVIDRAEELARTARVVLDAHLVSSAAAAAALVGSEDRLVLDAGSREARRIRRALGGRPIAPGAR